MRRFSGVVLLAGMMWALPGCGAQGTKSGKVLATVNGEAVTEATLEEEAKALPPYVRPIMETPQGRLQILDSIITRDLLLREALRRGLDRRSEVQDKIATIRRSVLLEALLKDVADKAPGLSEEALRKSYEANKESFQVGERVRVSHILFPDKEQAEAALKAARAGEPFEALMKEAAAAGGNAADLGLIEKGNFVPEFENAAFSAPQGVPTGPVRTQYGWHVILVTERRPAGLQSFEEVRERLIAEQRERVQRDAFETLVADLKKQSNVQVFAQLPPAAAAPGPGTLPATTGGAAPGAAGPAAPAAPPHGSR